VKNLNLKKSYYHKIEHDDILVKNIELMIAIGDLRDRNKALLGKTIEIREKILNEISIRKSISRDFLDYYFLAELCDLLSHNKKISETNIKKRKKNLVVYRKEYFTTDVVEADKKLFETNNSKLAGICASPGKVSGKVKVVSSSKDVNKIKKGDIMVARGTDFDLINAMQIAGGIITEEGGILSHASVISRELGTPCMIGVDNATKILKDKIFIEMDSDKGTISVKETAKMKKIFFLRHFKPDVDKNKPVAQWDLNKEGKESMKKLLKSNKFKNISKIFSSPEPKAKITADAIGKKYNISIIECKEVAEVDRSKAGFIEGDYTKLVEEYLTESGFEYPWENINNVRKRIKKFLKKLDKEKGDLLVISHGMWMSIFISRYFNKSIIKFWKNLKFGHILEIDYEKLKKSWKNA